MSGKDEFQGWIKIWRQIWNNPLWFSEPFTKAQAWIDLLLGANHARDSFEVRGVEIWIERGQVGWSEITMASRWKWSRDKVRRFLVRLESRDQIRQQKSNLTSIITICNYEVYQHIEDTSNTANDTPNNTAEKQQKNSKRYTNKNDKNGKNAENEENTPPNPLTGGTAGDASQTESFQLDADQPQPQQPSSQPKAKRERKPAQQMPEIPEALNTPAFRSAWTDFIDHRKSNRKPLSPKAAELNLKKCLELGPDTACSAIEQTIANGWTGIFEPKNTTPGVNGSKPKRDPRVPAHIPDHQAQMWILHQGTNCYAHIFGDLHANRDVD